MKKKYHMIGIGGVGVSALAHMLLQKGCSVSGSDVTAGALTDSIKAAGGIVFIGHSAENVATDSVVVYSTDIKKENVEFAAAKQMGCTMLHRSQLLQQLMQETRFPLCVAGTHGKTTTSSLLTWVLHVAKKHPSYAIGGVIPQLKTNAGHGNGEFFVAEACESDGTFLNYFPYGAIVTNVDDDHMDFYGDFNNLKKSFAKFMDQVVDDNCLFYCGDDTHLSAIAKRGVSYGFSEKCQLRISEEKTSDWTQSFAFTFRGKTYRDIQLNMAGKHNILNAAAVFGLALSLGIDEDALREALASFGGALRRCEKKGDLGGVLFIDDYAHHPTELTATLAGIRASIGSRRLIAIYQPHRYTRSQSCLDKYHGVFDAVDVLLLTEIYAARETPIPGITTEIVIADIRKSNQCPSESVERTHLAQHVAGIVASGDVVVTLGAGDVTKLSAEIMDCMKRSPVYGLIG